MKMLQGLQDNAVSLAGRCFQSDRMMLQGCEENPDGHAASDGAEQARPWGVRVRTGFAKLENLLAMKPFCLYNSRKSVVAVYAGRLVHR